MSTVGITWWVFIIFITNLVNSCLSFTLPLNGKDELPLENSCRWGAGGNEPLATRGQTWMACFTMAITVFMKQCRPHRNCLRWVTGGLRYSHLCRPLWPLLEHRNTNTTEWEWPVLKQKWPALQCSTQATLACVPKNFSWTLGLSSRIREWGSQVVIGVITWEVTVILIKFSSKHLGDVWGIEYD